MPGIDIPSDFRKVRMATTVLGGRNSMRRGGSAGLGSLGALALAMALTVQAHAQDTGPIKLGILNDQSGPNAELGGKGEIEAARMAVEDFGGSVLGRKVEIVAADHQNKADVASSIARRWFDQEGVVAITDVILTSAGLAVQ